MVIKSHLRIINRSDQEVSETTSTVSDGLFNAHILDSNQANRRNSLESAIDVEKWGA